MDASPENNSWCQEYVGPGIERVYAARFYEDASPVLVICRPDGSYVEFDPSDRKHRATIHDSQSEEWRHIEVLQHAKYINVGWMNVRMGLTS